MPSSRSRRRSGLIDILGNNAGIQHREPLLDVRLDDQVIFVDGGMTVVV